MLRQSQLALFAWFILGVLHAPLLVRADAYRLNIRIDLQKGCGEGEMTLHYHHRGQRPLEQLRLRLDMNLVSSGSAAVGSMAISSVHDGGGKELAWRYLQSAFGATSSDRGQIEIDFVDPLEANDEQALQIHFTLSDPRCLNQKMLTLQDDPYHSLDAWYPKAMTKTEEGWSTNDDRPSRYEVTIELPADWKSVASTGLITASSPGKQGSRIYQLSAKNVRGFTIYASPSWEEHRRSVSGADLGVHLPAEAAPEWAERILDAAAEAIGFFQKEYGEFPAEHLEIICPGTMTGNAHGSSATCNGITLWLHSRFAEQYQWLIAHEVAHQYFGYSIGIDRREIAWAPIGLGMTMDHEFMVQRGLDETSSRKMMRWFYLEAHRRGFDTTLSQPVEKPMREPPPWSSGWNMSLMHGKAYEVCTMLEGVLGKDNFRQMIRKIVTEKQGGVLTGREFVQYCNQFSDKPLEWFVADWIDGSRSLDYAVTSVRPGDGVWIVEISKIGDAAYPVVVQAETKLGDRLRQHIDLTKIVNRLEFNVTDALKAVVIDPEGVTPDVDESNNSWSNE
jgi:hypothetical protein